MKTLISLLMLTAFLVHWSDNSVNEQGFTIERSAGGSVWARIGQVPENIVNFRDGNILPGTRYCYRVRAFNAGGVSRYSRSTCKKTAAL